MFDKKRILLVGGSNMNLSLNITRMPDRGESVKDEGGVSYAPGGAGGNSAVAFARLGAETLFVTRLGRDLYGQKLFNYYRENGVSGDYIKVDPDFATGFTAVIKEADGSSREINFPGANEYLNHDTMIEALAKRPDGVYLSFESGFQNMARVAKNAVARGIPVFIDATPADANYPLETLSPAELFILGEEETRRYTGIRPTGSQDSLRAAFALWRKVNAKYIVINQGIKGAMIYDGRRCEIISPYDGPARPVDTDASDSAFAAAVTLEYLRCGDIKLAAKYALAAAAITASRYGASSSIPKDAELRAPRT